ncbi:hypothetical protein P691DRAFT_65767 [Macrolepiota fuliginosa MF-IS2]|uniref:Uncharacterized protein n=1 Tax=Macrolepiota fuliginosa MF-IS2 TaxID=1400762 RepID=A0A9P6C1V1_9AGAR|nr:hypothetical protein P691DRAFT_65767 [Macrolepiota fuliginosa MF-IS2]
MVTGVEGRVHKHKQLNTFRRPWFDFTGSCNKLSTTPEISTPYDTRRMSGNRPRSSIISLFDPLANSTTSEIPSTPRRDASDADKENHSSSPNSLTMTMFINKIAKPTLHPQPAPLKRRLIDLGDMTLEDAACPEALSVESMEEEFSAGFDQADDEENATLTFKDMVKAATPIRTLKTVVESPTSNTFPMARALFAGIAQEQVTPAPQPKNESENTPFMIEESPEGLDTESPIAEAVLEAQVPQAANRPELATESYVAPEDIPLPPSPVVAAQELTPLDPVVNHVNDVGDYSEEILPDHGIANPHVTMPEMTEEQPLNLHIPNSPSAEPADSAQSSEIPLADTSIPIVVSLSSPPISTAPLPEPEQETDKQNSPVARLRPHSSDVSPHDHNRFSIDLHASFQMHMQSDDMSFDLLSDRLSFFNSSGGESFLSTIEDDPSFDLETERINMEKALKTYSGGKDTKEKVVSTDDVSSVSSSPAPATPVDVPGTPLTPGHQSDDSRTTNARL